MLTLFFPVLLFIHGQVFSFSRSTDIGLDILQNVQFSRRVDASILRRLVKISLQECAIECGLRSSCFGINYERMLQMCELIGNTPPLLSPETTRGWVYIEVTDNFKQTVMNKHCNGREACPTGQKCSQSGDSYLCSTKECNDPPLAQDEYLPNEGSLHRVGAKIRVTSSLSGDSYSMQCCSVGTWAQNCFATTSSPLTSQSTASKTVSPTTVSPITISEDDWFTLQSDFRIRQLAPVTSLQQNWESAKGFCEKNGGSLAHVYTEMELRLIHDWLVKTSSDNPIWVGGHYIVNDGTWGWHRDLGAVTPVESSIWGPNYPNPDEERRCTALYRDIVGDDEYYIMNDNCNVQLGFICERDFTDIIIEDIDWFFVNSTSWKRNVAYVNNPTLSWTKAQKLCENNGGTLAHVYYVEELALSLRERSVLSEERLWVGAQYRVDTERWYWWGNSSNDVTYVSNTLWPSDVASVDVDSCISLFQHSPTVSYLVAKRCHEDHSFLCQKELQIDLPEEDWFLIDGDVSRLRSVVYVNAPTLNWEQSRDVCGRNGGTLVHIYTDNEILRIEDGIRSKGIEPAGRVNEKSESTHFLLGRSIWTGGKYEPDRSEWVWSSDSDSDQTAIDAKMFSTYLLDRSVGECIQLQQEISPEPFNIMLYVLANSACTVQTAFLCQRDYVYSINEADWFLVNDRNLALVPAQVKWDTAQVICETNGGVLAYVRERSELDQVANKLYEQGLATPENIWLGGKFDFEWVWVNENNIIDSSLWSSGIAPTPSDEICVKLLIRGEMFYIHNDLCTSEYSFMCQKNVDM